MNNPSGSEVPEEYAASLFEMFHEALNDVARRAQASAARVVLTITPQEVIIVIRDDGFGFSGGLAQIGRRAAGHQGTCAVASAPDDGTTVAVSLPLP